MKLSALTLIVPIKNEAANIDAFLNSVPEKINMIVVDAGTDDTSEMISHRRRSKAGLQMNGYRIDYDPRLKVYEFDHRRLDRGILRKTFHSLSRCALLLCGLKSLLRGNDWGYWGSKPGGKRLTAHL